MNNEPQKQEQNPDQRPVDPKEKDRKVVIRILKIAAFTVCAILVVYLLLTVIEKVRGNAGGKETETEDKSIAAIFYDADFDEDITKDQGYMDQDRNIYFTDPDMGTTVSLNEDTLPGADPEVRFLYEVINYVIAGDTEAYQNCLAKSYLDTLEGGQVAPFTPQKLYEINISRYLINEDGTKTYKVEYMIYKNNGTYRSDVGSDAIKPSFFTLESYGESYRITQIINYRTT
ncbi:MAG: hypothetical protein IJT60_07390 [Clostridia bacterium]|nr:hypothetical protein [Clostridia bacterium]